MTHQWPTEEGGASALIDFADVLSSALEEHGHCTIGLFEGLEAPGQAAARLSNSMGRYFQPPPPAFASAYLGTDHSSDIAHFKVDTLDDPFVSFCVEQLEAAAHLLEPWMSQSMGFEPDLPCSNLIFRRRRGGRVSTDDEASRGRFAAGKKHITASEQEELSSTGFVEEFLQWASRRRLCLFLFIDISGTITLKPNRPSEDSQDVLLEPSPNTLLILQHDRFTHTYAPRSGDLVLQAWVLEKRPELMLDTVVSEGPKQDDVRGVPADVMANVRCPLQVTGAAVRASGYKNVNEIWLALSHCIDMVRSPPETRWLWDEVLEGLDGVIDDWGISKHAAFLDDLTLASFDPVWFGATAAEAVAWQPAQRMSAEVGFECLADGGWSRKTLKGKRIDTWFATVGTYDIMLADLGEFWTPGAWNANSAVHEASRLARTFGFMGSVQNIDTACSSSNICMGLAHQSLMRATETGVGARSAIILAGVTLMSPDVFVGLSLAHMLSSKGRARSFDNSASGFIRSEGSNCCLVQTLDEENTKSATGKFAYGTVISTMSNQDGRSASLTAPNGPSQTACIKACMRQAGLGPDSVTKFECHGTGTAIGDPIEVGSCRTVMRGRKLPLVQCSSKSSHGHMEVAAGNQSFLKTLMEISHCASTANCHLRVLNFNIDVAGYPILHPVEVTPLDGDGPNSICGASSFGFGGSNAHANLAGQPYQRTTNRSKSEASKARALQLEKLDYVTLQCPKCLGLKCWLCGIAVPKCAPRVKHRCASVREDASSYELCSNCYDGKYVFQAPGYAEVSDPGLPIYVRGSWSHFKALEEMLWIPSRTSGHYEFSITLGPALQERFQMVVDKDLTNLLYPTQGDAGEHVHIDGPDDAGDGKYWLINGLQDRASAGTKYNIRFTWGRSKRQVEWKRAAA